MVDIVTYLEFSYSFKKFISEDSIVYKNGNHSIMISKKEEDKLYLLYKKQVLVVFTVNKENEQLILNRLENIFEKECPEMVDADVNGRDFVEILVNSNFIYDSATYKIENLPALHNYDPVVVRDYLLFLDTEDNKIVYCIQLNETSIRKKEKSIMPTENYYDKKDTKINTRLKNTFLKVIDMTSYKYRIELELLKIGCKGEGSTFVFRDKIILKLDEKDLYLSVRNTDIKDVAFKLSETTLDEVTEYLEGIYL